VDLGLMGKVLFVYAVDDKGIEYALYLGRHWWSLRIFQASFWSHG
jgi:hypothetical protein